jgi:hypothetical protein
MISPQVGDPEEMDRAQENPNISQSYPALFLPKDTKHFHGEQAVGARRAVTW